jgi:hypothetical protein
MPPYHAVQPPELPTMIRLASVRISSWAVALAATVTGTGLFTPDYVNAASDPSRTFPYRP